MNTKTEQETKYCMFLQVNEKFWIFAENVQCKKENGANVLDVVDAKVINHTFPFEGSRIAFLNLEQNKINMIKTGCTENYSKSFVQLKHQRIGSHVYLIVCTTGTNHIDDSDHYYNNYDVVYTAILKICSEESDIELKEFYEPISNKENFAYGQSLEQPQVQKCSIKKFGETGEWQVVIR